MRERILIPALLLSALLLIPIILAIAFPTRQPPPTTLSGQVVDAAGPVADADVRLQGEARFVRTDAAGRFTIANRAGRNTLAAWKDGYFIATAAASPSPVSIKLRKLPAHDFEDYHWIDPSPDLHGQHNCANCHAGIFQEWKNSGHARSATGRHFQDVYRDLLKEHPQGSAVCNSCHAPTVPFGEPAFADLRLIAGIAAQGVHCDLCHKVQDAGLGEIGLTHGYFGMQLLRPKEGQLFFGPLPDASRGEETYSPLYRQSRYCASCHEGMVFGVPVYTTYSEWLASAAARAGKQCQDCHMAPTGTMTNIAPGHGGIDRDPKTLASHGMFMGSKADMLKQCLKLSVEVARLAEGVHARVEIRVEGVGHRVPTGFIDRHIVLVVAGYEDQERVEAISGPRLPDVVGKELKGQTGKLFARQLKGSDGKPPAPFWRAADDPVDTRLTSETTDLSRYSFPKEVDRVRVRLVYRRFWAEARQRHGWPDDDITVAETIALVR